MPAVARKGDPTTTGHGCDSTSTVIGPTGESAKVYVNNIAVECKGNPVAPHTIPGGNGCVSHSAVINVGSSTVSVGGIPIARVGDSTDSGAISRGSPDVFVGGPGGGGTGGGGTGGGGTGGGGQPPGLIGDFDPNLFIRSGTNGLPSPRANAVAGKDYTYREDGNGGYLLINLNSFTPSVTEVQTPTGANSGIVKTWNNIPGVPDGQFQTLQAYTMAQYNPPLNQFNNLDQSQRQTVLSDYQKLYNIPFITNGDSGADANPAYYESDAFKNFLLSQGIDGKSS